VIREVTYSSDSVQNVISIKVKG